MTRFHGWARIVMVVALAGGFTTGVQSTSAAAEPDPTSLYAWGLNRDGRLGDGTTEAVGSPSSCSLRYSGDTHVPPLSDTHLRASFVGSAGLADKSITFTVADRAALAPRQTFSATTDGSGTAASSVRLQPGTYVVKASFAGDDVYEPCRAANVVLVVDAIQVLPGQSRVTEGDSGTSDLQVPVTLSSPASATITVPWTTVHVPGAPGNQADPATDYSPTSGTAIFAPGQTATTVHISVSGDETDEDDEYLVVSFHDPTNARMGGFWGLGFGTIVDDDPVGLADLGGTFSASGWAAFQCPPGYASTCGGGCQPAFQTLDATYPSSIGEVDLHVEFCVFFQFNDDLGSNYTVVGAFGVSTDVGTITGSVTGTTIASPVGGFRFDLLLTVTSGDGAFASTSGRLVTDIAGCTSPGPGPTIGTVTTFATECPPADLVVEP